MIYIVVFLQLVMFGATGTSNLSSSVDNREFSSQFNSSMTMPSAKVPTGGAIGDGAKVQASARILSKSIKGEAAEFDISIYEGVMSPAEVSSSDDNEVKELKMTIKKLKIQKLIQIRIG